MKKAARKRATPRPRDLWTLNAAAAETGLAKSTLYDRTESGDIPSIRLGCGTLVVRLSDVRAYQRKPRARGPRKKRAKK